MRRVIRRRTRIGVYVAFLFVLWGVGLVALLWLQQLRFDRRIYALKQELVGFLQEKENGSAEPVSESVSIVSDDSKKPSFLDAPRYIVLGHGRSKKWGYLDVQFVCDGAVERFYYRRDNLLQLPQDIELSCFRHENFLKPGYYVAKTDDDDFFAF